MSTRATSAPPSSTCAYRGTPNRFGTSAIQDHKVRSGGHYLRRSHCKKVPVTCADTSSGCSGGHYSLTRALRRNGAESVLHGRSRTVERLQKLKIMNQTLTFVRGSGAVARSAGQPVVAATTATTRIPAGGNRFPVLVLAQVVAATISDHLKAEDPATWSSAAGSPRCGARVEPTLRAPADFRSEAQP